MDCFISLKFGTENDHVIADTLQMSNVDESLVILPNFVLWGLHFRNEATYLTPETNYGSIDEKCMSSQNML